MYPRTVSIARHTVSVTVPHLLQSIQYLNHCDPIKVPEKICVTLCSLYCTRYQIYITLLFLLHPKNYVKTVPSLFHQIQQETATSYLQMITCVFHCASLLLPIKYVYNLAVPTAAHTTRSSPYRH